MIEPVEFEREHDSPVMFCVADKEEGTLDAYQIRYAVKCRRGEDNTVERLGVREVRRTKLAVFRWAKDHERSDATIIDPADFEPRGLVRIEGGPLPEFRGFPEFYQAPPSVEEVFEATARATSASQKPE